jgi:filamentous hemagglutinin
VKELTTNKDSKEVDKFTNAIGHAIVGALVAQASGNNALSGAAGAAGGELIAQLIVDNLYPNTKVEDLTEAQRQTVSSLATIAAGAIGGAAGGDMAGAATGADAGNNAVNNNLLSPAKGDALNKALDDQKAGKNLLEASQNIVKLMNEDRTSNILLDKYQQGSLNDNEKQELAGLLNQYGYELQSIYGYSEQQAAEAIHALTNGQAFVALPDDAKSYYEALRYLKGYSDQSGQAALGTDALLVLPGAPGLIARGALAAGGSYQTGYGIGQLSDGNYADGALNVGLGTAAIFGGIGGQSSISKSETGIVSSGKDVSWQDASQSLDKKAPSAAEKVTAELKDTETGKVFTDTNQGNRSDYFLGDASRPTLIEDIVQVKIDKRPDKNYPNGNMATAHAEIGAIQQAYEQGMTSGKDMVMTVGRQEICTYCLSDIKVMAERAGLKSLTLFEEKTGRTLYWEVGTKSFQVRGSKYE